MSDIKKELEFLKEEIKKHDELYYNKNMPEISDFEYDTLRRRLNEIEARFAKLQTSDSPSQKIGSPVSESGFSKITHKKTMLSLDNAFSFEELQNFITRAAKFLSIDENTFDFCAEHKIDGLSASIVYENGKLKYAATRGDGFVGEDVSENIKTIKSIPSKISLSGEVEIRGEVYMPIEAFKQLNEERELLAEPLFANPRNAAAGSLRQLDSKITESRNLKFFAYYIDSDLEEFKKQTEVLKRLKDLNFEISEYRYLKKFDELCEYCEYTKKIRDSLGYEIDGVVFKINSFEFQRRLGSVARNPRHSIAFKFKPSEAVTILKDIIINVGRTGKVIPVAILEPVNISGVMVSKATLHNFEEIERKNVSIGDEVKVLRAGDVIPKIVEVTKKNANSQVFEMPKFCPFCETELVKYPNLVDIYCPNHYSCQSQIIRYLSYFTSKNCFDIGGLGEKQIAELYNDGRIKTAVDIFKLEENNNLNPLQNKLGWGKVSVEKLFKSINERKTIVFSKFLTSLGIPGVGEITAQMLSDKFETLEILQQTSIDQINEIDGIGELLSHEIVSFFSLNINKKFIDDILNYVTIFYKNENKFVNTSGKFYKKTIVFTGTLQRIGRSEAKQLATSVGAFVSSAVSAKTDFLVVGKDPGSKFKKANELGVQIINEENFIKEC